MLSFSTLGCFDRSLDEIIALAKKYGIEIIEIRGIGGKINNSEITEFSEPCATKTKQKLEKAGIFPFILGTSASFHSPENYEAKMKEARESVAIASRMGIPNIRVFGDKIEGDREECLLRVINGISELCSFAESFGVGVLLEVHGHFNTKETLLPVAEALSSRSNFGIIWDIEHSHKVYGEGWEDFYLAIRPYIKHVHIKDYNDTLAALSPIGEGNVPIAPIITRLIKDGYSGAFSLEWEEKWHPELGKIEPALDAFVRIAREAKCAAR